MDSAPLDYVPLARPTTHQELIYRIKRDLNLPHLESSFISRNSILEYIAKIHSQNQLLRQALDPPSIQPSIHSMQHECARMRIALNQYQQEEEFLKEAHLKLEQDLLFMTQYHNRNLVLCDSLEKQIQSILDEKSVSLSHSESEQISNLMDRFIGYFEDPDGRDQPPSLNSSSMEGRIKVENSSGVNSQKSMILKEIEESKGGMAEFKHPKLQIVNYTYTGYEDM